MRFVLFEDLNERHLKSSLARALCNRGHEVIEVPPAWKGWRFPVMPGELARVGAALDSALEARPEVLVNFRPSSLTKDMLRRIRREGIQSVVWLADDPVLYNVCYKEIAGAYDVVLNCGDQYILKSYLDRNGVVGVNFPFWADNTSFPFLYSQESAALDFVFLGNCVGHVRRSRYDLIASLPGRGRIFGKVDADPKTIAAGFVKGERSVAEALATAKLAINIPQFFCDYKGHEFDYPGLSALGSFEFPSRVIQYAAVGLPVASYGRRYPPELFPEMLVAADPRSFRQTVYDALRDQDGLDRRAETVHARFLTSFSADTRARFLEFLLCDPKVWRNATGRDRARLFAEFGDSSPIEGRAVVQGGDVRPSLPSVEEQRSQLRSLKFESPRKWRVLFIGTAANGLTDVVSCLLRSLRNLGHHVTHVDPLLRRELLKAGPVYSGGFGRNYIDLEAMMKATDRAYSDIVVCVGGGLCLTNADAEAARSAGLVLIGITLCDPDVQDSIMHDVSNFDFHFTNSRLALDRYQERGITNTSLMPFGIDRNWLLSSIVEDPAYRADIICLGHATGRPERIEAMGRLAETFSSVRTYGKGWPLSGSIAVSGVELLQASRGGSVHINFALTRAGFTNVKCGVFESIGSGGVVCTDASAEMSQYFEYGSEIVFFSDPENLVDKVRWLLGDPDARESIRRAAFRRLIDEHLYEHRWRSVLDLVETEIFEKQRILSGDRAAQIRKVAEGFWDFNIRVLITGFYGHRNLGDELILRSLSEAAAETRPEVQFVVASNMPAGVETLHELEAVRLVEADALADVAATVDATVLGGGGLWHDHTFSSAGGHASLFNGTGASLGGYARPSVAALSHGAPFHVFGMGVGPLENDGAKRFLRFLGDQADSIVVRDEGSAALLSAIEGWSNSVEVSPDAVYGLPITEITKPPRLAELTRGLPIIVVNLRPWNATESEGLSDRLAEALTDFLEHTPCALVGLPMQAGDSLDTRAITQLFERISMPCPKLVLPWSDNVSEVAGSISAARIVIAMRLHACLLAHRLRRPTLGLAYDPKVLGHFREVARERYSLSLREPASFYHHALMALESEAGTLPKPVSDRIAALEVSARKGITDFLHRLPHSPMPHRKSYVGHVHAAKAKGIRRGKLSPGKERVSLDAGPIRGNWGKPVAAAEAMGDFRVVSDFSEMTPPATILESAPLWIDMRLKSGAVYQLWYRIHLDYLEDKNAGVILFEVDGDDKPNRNEWGYFSEAIGRFRYMPHGTDGLANITFKVPDPSGVIRIGFRSWRNVKPILISPTVVLYKV